MTVRQTKLMVVVAAAAVIAALMANLAVIFLRHRGVSGASDLLPEVAIGLLLWTIWRRLSGLEAEHGPDYVEPPSKYAKPLLIVAGVLALVLAALAAYLIASRR
jgi:hypothetical protein